MAMIEIGFGAFTSSVRPTKKCISEWMADTVTRHYAKYYTFLNRLGVYAIHENRFLEEVILANICVVNELFRVKEPSTISSLFAMDRDYEIGELRAAVRSIQLMNITPEYRKELAYFEQTVYSESYQNLMLRAMRSKGEACVAYSTIFGMHSVNTSFTRNEIIDAIPALMAVISLTKADCANKPALCALISKIEIQMKLEGI